MPPRMPRLEERLKLLRDEVGCLASVFPHLSLHVDNEGGVWVRGIIGVTPEVGYSVDLWLPEDFPGTEPALFCDPAEIPWLVDRHVFEQNGKACLCARSETRLHWPWGSDLRSFLEALVVPWLTCQFYYDTHGCWPPTGERSHGKPGIIEAYTEILEPVGEVNESVIRQFMLLLARKNVPRGHELCPCGSGLKLRNCHREFFFNLRSRIDPRHVRLDLREAFGSGQTRSGSVPRRALRPTGGR